MMEAAEGRTAARGPRARRRALLACALAAAALAFAPVPARATGTPAAPDGTPAVVASPERQTVIDADALFAASKSHEDTGGKAVLGVDPQAESLARCVYVSGEYFAVEPGSHVAYVSIATGANAAFASFGTVARDGVTIEPCEDPELGSYAITWTIVASADGPAAAEAGESAAPQLEGAPLPQSLRAFSAEKPWAPGVTVTRGDGSSVTLSTTDNALGQLVLSADLLVAETRTSDDGLDVSQFAHYVTTAERSALEAAIATAKAAASDDTLGDDDLATQRQALATAVSAFESARDAKYGQLPVIALRAHVRDIGWQDAVRVDETLGSDASQSSGSDGARLFAGTTGEARRMEALQVRVAQNEASGNVLGGELLYRAHIRNHGDQSARSSSANAAGAWDAAWPSGPWTYAGTIGKGLRLEALAFQLTGELAEKYDLYYSLHVKGGGWLDWAKCDDLSVSSAGWEGTQGRSLRSEAVKLTLAPKGADGSSQTPAWFDGAAPLTASYRVVGRLQNSDGSYPEAYDLLIASGIARYGASVSWSRAADVSYQMVSGSFSLKRDTRVVRVDIPRRGRWASVWFDADGGAPEPAAQEVMSGQRVSAPAAEPTREGFDFAGWYRADHLVSGNAAQATAPDAADDAAPAWDFARDVVSGDTLLRARWTPRAKAVSFTVYLRRQQEDGSLTDFVEYGRFDGREGVEQTRAIQAPADEAAHFEPFSLTVAPTDGASYYVTLYRMDGRAEAGEGYAETPVVRLSGTAGTPYFWRCAISDPGVLRLASSAEASTTLAQTLAGALLPQGDGETVVVDPGGEAIVDNPDTPVIGGSRSWDYAFEVLAGAASGTASARADFAWATSDDVDPVPDCSFDLSFRDGLLCGVAYWGTAASADAFRLDQRWPPEPPTVSYTVYLRLQGADGNFSEFETYDSFTGREGVAATHTIAPATTDADAVRYHPLTFTVTPTADAAYYVSLLRADGRPFRADDGGDSGAEAALAETPVVRMGGTAGLPYHWIHTISDPTVLSLARTQVVPRGEDVSGGYEETDYVFAPLVTEGSGDTSSRVDYSWVMWGVSAPEQPDCSFDLHFHDGLLSGYVFRGRRASANALRLAAV